MKFLIKIIASCFCLVLSGAALTQNVNGSQGSTEGDNKPKTTKRSAKDMIKYKKPLMHSTSKASSLYQRKYMPFNNKKVWVLGTTKREGHWNTPQSTEIGTDVKNKPLYDYPVSTLIEIKSYDKAVLLPSEHNDIVVTSNLPKKEIDLDQIVYDRDWSDHGTSAIYKDGADGKLNVSFFKTIKKNSKIILPNDFDHIIVTDTLFAPVLFLNTDGKPRNDDRSYIKIVANCIVYESPINLLSLKSKSKTDYVFSAKEIIFKSTFNDLKPYELKPVPPFVDYDSDKVRVHKDTYSENEIILSNRLIIDLMKQIVTKLNGELDDWKRDKLLIKFQQYRYSKVNTDLLDKDEDYQNKFNELTGDFEFNHESTLERIRTVNGLTILVEGKVQDLQEEPFKYYVRPSKATLVPMMDENTGALDKLGDMLFSASGDTKRSITMEVKLGYKKVQFDQANQVLKQQGFILESNFPKELVFIDGQPLQLNGEVTGKIIPIDSDLLKLEIELQEDNLSLIELIAHNDVSFYVNYKHYDLRKDERQKMLFEVPDEIRKQIDYEKMINEFNVIETNTLTDIIKITSNLSSDLGEDAEGKLNYIEVSLEFLFENGKRVFRGPFKMSSASVLGSEKSELFTKYSENYSIKVTGKAHYENGEREIKDDFIITSPFIELEEGIFKNSTSN
jgi:hypothetical protein